MPPVPAPALRYATFYGALFLTLGIYLPFFPVFLKSRGLDATEIGLLFALLSWTKVATTPAIAQISDRSGRAKATLVGPAGRRSGISHMRSVRMPPGQRPASAEGRGSSLFSPSARGRP